MGWDLLFTCVKGRSEENSGEGCLPAAANEQKYVRKPPRVSIGDWGETRRRSKGQNKSMVQKRGRENCHEQISKMEAL